MSAFVVDTSIWIEFFRGTPLPALEDGLNGGAIELPPLVVAELLSAPLTRAQRRDLSTMLANLPLHPTPFAHWQAVGELRSGLAAKGLTMSTPDAHVAQCAIDRGAALWSRDRIFGKVADLGLIKLYEGA